MAERIPSTKDAAFITLRCTRVLTEQSATEEDHKRVENLRNTAQIADSSVLPQRIREVHESLPVVEGQAVAAGADVVSDVPADQRRLQGRHLPGANARQVVQRVDRRRANQREKLAALVGPEIL